MPNPSTAGGVDITIEIDVVRGVVTAGTFGGNARGGAGTTIRWVGAKGRQFTLDFFELEPEPGGTGVSLRGVRRRWPFGGSPPPGTVVGPTNEFVGTLAPGFGKALFKYYVTVHPDEIRLDPIIIFE
jgi:hypothetical protein